MVGGYEPAEGHTIDSPTSVHCGAAADALTSHLAVMADFLETHRAVTLAYLARIGSANSRAVCLDRRDEMPAETGGRGGDRTVIATRNLSVAHDRYLDDHRLGSNAVLPFACAMELMAETAGLAAPARVITGLDDVRVLKGIVVPDHEALAVRVTARADGDRVDVAIDGERPHYRAVARLDPAGNRGMPTERPPDMPAELSALPPLSLPIADIYRDLLFHGPHFQRLAAVTGLDARGASAVAIPSARAGGSDIGAGSSWLLDPVLVDCSFQLQVIWSRLQWDMLLLPAELAAFRIFDAPRPTEQVRLELRIRPESREPMNHADHWLFGADGRLLATLSDVVGVGSRALNRLASIQPRSTVGGLR